MTRPEVTGRRAAFTIPEFCEAHRMSESFYYKMRSRGLGPVECRVLDKITITDESAAAWRRARETTTTTA